MDPALRQLYRQAVFRGEPFPADWPTDFAIITAYDPEGRVVAPTDNLAADARLRAELGAGGHRTHRVTGGSADGRHQEPGWAAPIGLPGAVELGKRYRQLAVFYVRAGELSLIDCADGSSEDLGRPFGLV
ncbi:MAG: DUF3293 domain-containing protein [Opitutia bacterium]